MDHCAGATSANGDTAATASRHDEHPTACVLRKHYCVSLSRGLKLNVALGCAIDGTWHASVLGHVPDDRLRDVETLLRRCGLAQRGGSHSALETRAGP